MPPCINHGIKKGMNNVQQEMKDAVSSGYWNLYRYSPETKKFTLDSKGAVHAAVRLHEG